MNKIIAKVQFNQGIALVMDKPIELKYYRDGNLMWGTDGFFYVCYYREPGSKNAFAGRSFDITLENGEIVKCRGDWWSAGSGLLAEKLGIEFVSGTANDVESLKKCYVFRGLMADKRKWEDIMAMTANLCVFPYRDYEKVLKYDDERIRWIEKYLKQEKITKQVIEEAKRHKRNYLIINDILDKTINWLCSDN